MSNTAEAPAGRSGEEDVRLPDFLKSRVAGNELLNSVHVVLEDINFLGLSSSWITILLIFVFVVAFATLNYVRCPTVRERPKFKKKDRQNPLNVPQNQDPYRFLQHLWHVQQGMCPKAEIESFGPLPQWMEGYKVPYASLRKQAKAANSDSIWRPRPLSDKYADTLAKGFQYI